MADLSLGSYPAKRVASSLSYQESKPFSGTELKSVHTIISSYEL